MSLALPKNLGAFSSVLGLRPRHLCFGIDLFSQSSSSVNEKGGACRAAVRSLRARLRTCHGAVLHGQIIFRTAERAPRRSLSHVVRTTRGGFAEQGCTVDSLQWRLAVKVRRPNTFPVFIHASLFITQTLSSLSRCLTHADGGHKLVSMLRFSRLRSFATAIFALIGLTYPIRALRDSIA